MKKYFAVLTIAITFFFGLSAMPLYAEMSGGGMTNSGGFGMMNGMAGTPVVDDDGIAYLVRWEPNQNPGPMPNSNSFKSTLMAIDPKTDKVVSLTLDGILSRPVLSDDGNMLVATASLPDFNDFKMFANYGESDAESSQSILYAINLPLTESTLPGAISLDGSYASIPVIANGSVYVTTTSRGDYMMGRNMFDGMFHDFDFNNLEDQKSFLYVVGLDGTIKARIEIE
jgi:hypothetical protein